MTEEDDLKRVNERTAKRTRRKTIEVMSLVEMMMTMFV
jgi:hypothetical protein